MRRFYYSLPRSVSTAMAENVYFYQVSLRSTSGDANAAINLPFPSSLIDTKRGLNMAVLDCHNANCISFYNFDIINGGATAWDAFAARIETFALSVNLFILIAVERGRSGHLDSITPRARRALQCIGGTGFDSIPNPSAVATWALAGQKGAAVGSAQEMVETGTAPVDLPASLAAMTGSCRAVGLRATSNMSISAWVVLNDSPLVSGGSNGINVVIIDPSLATVQRVASFDINTNISNGDIFADLINATGVDMIVAVAFKDLQPSKLSQRAKLALQSLGSTVATDVIPERASWVLISSKLLGVDGASEVLVVDRSAQTDFYFNPTSQDRLYIAYTLQARGSFGGDLEVRINGSALSSVNADGQRTFRIAAVSPDTGLVEGFRALDISNDNDVDALRAFVELTPPGYQVAVVCQLLPGSSIPPAVVEILSPVGALQVGAMDSSNMYGLVGYKGAGPGRAFDRVVSRSGSSTMPDNFALTCQVVARNPRPIIVAEAFSAGFESGNRGYVVINMRTMTFDSQNRGINVVVFDGRGRIANVALFDTHGDGGASDRLAELIDGLSNGMRVALVVVDEAMANLNERAKNAIRSLGGGKIGLLGYRDSYALVGCKGRAAGLVAELIAKRTARGALVKSFEPTTEPGSNDLGNWLSVSSFPVLSNHILLDGKPIEPVVTFGDGIQVILVGETFPKVFEVIDEPSLTDVLESILARATDPKTIFAMYVPPDSRHYPAAARIGRLIGSMWASQLGGNNGLLVIGVSGSSPGSALELKVSGPETTVSLWTGFITTLKTRGTRNPRPPRFLLPIFVGVVAVGIAGIIWLNKRLNDEVAAPPSHYQQLATIPTLPVDPPPDHPVLEVKRRAVFVAIDYYGLGDGIPNQFNGAARKHVNKAMQMYINKKVIRDEQLDIRFLDDDPNTPDNKRASKDNITEALDWLVRETRDGEVALFHFFGHGKLIEPKVGLITASKSSTKPQFTSFLWDTEIREKIANISRRVNFTFVFNACHSGNILGDDSVERGISIAAAQRKNAAWFKTTKKSVTSFLTEEIRRRLNEKKPLPTYADLRSILENAMKNEYEASRIGRPDLPEINVILQSNNGITNPNTLQWLDRLT